MCVQCNLFTNLTRVHRRIGSLRSAGKSWDSHWWCEVLCWGERKSNHGLLTVQKIHLSKVHSHTFFHMPSYYMWGCYGITSRQHQRNGVLHCSVITWCTRLLKLYAQYTNALLSHQRITSNLWNRIYTIRRGSSILEDDAFRCLHTFSQDQGSTGLNYYCSMGRTSTENSPQYLPGHTWTKPLIQVYCSLASHTCHCWYIQDMMMCSIHDFQAVAWFWNPTAGW